MLRQKRRYEHSNLAVDDVGIESRSDDDFDLSVDSIKDGSNMTNDDATEYLEYNTIRALDYMPSEFRPIMIKSLLNDL